MSAYDNLLAEFERRGKVIKTSSDTALVQCPCPAHAHGDQNPSLSVRRAKDSVLIFCQTAQQGAKYLIETTWLDWNDLYDDRNGVTHRYDDGREVKRKPDKTFTQSGHTNGQVTQLYHLSKIKNAALDDVIYLVEGEKDVETIDSLGLIATTAPMGARNFAKVDDAPLHGRSVIAIVDKDDQGKEWAQQVREKLGGYAHKLRFMQARIGKDASDQITATGKLDLEPWKPPVRDAEDDQPPQERKFKIGSFADVGVREATWLLPGVLPDDDLVVLVGEEGIGKGLFSVDCIARVTKAGHNVLIISTEDDFERDLRPRLDVAEAVASRCYFMTIDRGSLKGQPQLPADVVEVAEMINEYKIKMVYIDPWVSSVSSGLKLRDTQDARRAIRPLTQLARSTHCSVLAVVHPNRGEGSIRDRVGLTAVLRQEARIMLFALEPPDDDSKIIVGIEKANNTKRVPATIYHKVPKSHPGLINKIYALEEDRRALPLTIRQWDDQFRADKDHRQSDLWPQVQALGNQGQSLIGRADIVAIYEAAGSSDNAANKAINRWVAKGKLIRKGVGLYALGGL